MKILELILRIVLKLIEVLSSKPSDAPPLNIPKNNDIKRDDTQSTVNSTGATVNNQNTANNDPTKSIVTYNDEVNDLLAQVMAAQRATHEADLNEIIRLRKEVSRLQEELILAKANVQGKRLPDKTQTFQGTDDVRDSADQQK